MRGCDWPEVWAFAARAISPGGDGNGTRLRYWDRAGELHLSVRGCGSQGSLSSFSPAVPRAAHADPQPQLLAETSRCLATLRRDMSAGASRHYPAATTVIVVRDICAASRHAHSTHRNSPTGSQDVVILSVPGCQTKFASH